MTQSIRRDFMAPELKFAIHSAISISTRIAVIFVENLFLINNENGWSTTKNPTINLSPAKSIAERNRSIGVFL